MEILGLSPVFITLIICAIGIVYQLISGMVGKKLSEFNPAMAMTTTMLALVTAVGLVAPIVDAIPNDSSALTQLQVVVGQVGLVMGMDSAVRKGAKTAKKIQDKKKDITKPEVPKV